jgi:hypothetical protein
MDARLALLIQDYRSAVATAVRLLCESGIPLPESHVDWVCNGISHTGALRRGIKYFKHGSGCAVHLPGGTVDFDFGEQGEIIWIDAWHISTFADERLAEYGFASSRELIQTLRQAIATEDLLVSLPLGGVIQRMV